MNDNTPRDPRQMKGKEFFDATFYNSVSKFIMSLIYAGVIYLVGFVSWWGAFVLFIFLVIGVGFRIIIITLPSIFLPFLLAYILKEIFVGKKLDNIYFSRSISARDWLNNDFVVAIVGTIQNIILAVICYLLYLKFFYNTN